MPFEITNQGDYLVVRVFGILTNHDLMHVADESEAVEDSFPTVRNRVVDVTAVEVFEVDFPAMLTLARRRRARQFEAPIKSAVIARHPIEVGLARMFRDAERQPANRDSNCAKRARSEGLVRGGVTGSQAKHAVTALKMRCTPAYAPS